MTDLLRCPFCGGKPLQNGPDNPGHEYWISCQSCQASSLMRSNVEAAQSAWNARTPSAGRSDLAGTNFVPWLRGLAENGGKGVVNNIDARCLGRIAAEIARLQEAKRRALDIADERAKEANGLRQQLAKKVVVTDRMCEIALEADAVSRIQGFSYEKRHVIRDIWLEPGKQEIWSSPVAGPDEYQSFQKRCRIERMRKVLEEVFALTDEPGKAEE